MKSKEIKMVELSKNELSQINGGDDITEAVFYALGYFWSAVTQGATVRESSGSYGIVGAHL